MPPPRIGLVGSIERAGVNAANGANGASNRPGWERIAVQIDSGAIDAVGPKEIASAFGMKETPKSKNGVGFVAASGSSIRN